MAFLSPFFGTSLGCKATKFFKAFLLKCAPRAIEVDVHHVDAPLFN